MSHPRIISVTPVVDTAIYSSGDHLGSIMTISGAAPDFSLQGAVLDSVIICDKASQSSALDILFFNYLPTVASADNAALNISDSEMAAKCIGSVTFAGSDYKALSANSVGSLKNIVMAVQPAKTSGENAANDAYNLYAIMCCRGTPTYASTSDLTVKFGFVYP